ncbi:MAG: flagellar biosynthesis protein FliQ [Chloroflexota bacterium]|nr:MAG: flagellar biosynthesis protein FliQ [Chloroflexota bacterium]
MNEQAIVRIGQDAFMTGLMVSAPILGVSLVIGLAIGVFQAVTQINEATLSFVPKILAIFAVVVLLGPWMLTVLLEFTTRLITSLPEMAR